MPQEEKCQTQQQCADQTFNQQQDSAQEQMEMNEQIGGAVAEIQCAAGSTGSDCAQQQRTAEVTMQASEDRRYEHCVGATAGSQAGCGKKKRKRKRKSRRKRKTKRKSKKYKKKRQQRKTKNRRKSRKKRKNKTRK